MIRDKETLAILSLLVFVLALIGAGFLYVFNDNIAYEAKPKTYLNELKEENHSFYAQVKDRDGSFIKDAEVIIKDNDINLLKKTDKEGVAEFYDIKSTRFLVTIKAKGYKEKTKWYVAGEKKEVILENAITKIETILRLHGSNTIGAKYGPALAEGFLEKMGVHTIKVEQIGSPQEKLISGIRGEKRVGIEIKAHGSSTGFKSLKKDICDIGMASRPIKDKEYMALADLGDLRSFASEHIVGLDGIAVIVHQSNSINSLSIDVLSKIFRGEIKNWKNTGSNLDGDIVLYARDSNSGTYDTFKSLVLKKKPLLKGAKRFESNANLSDSVAEDRNAIGFTGLPYIRNSKAIAVSSVKGGSKVFPTFFTVATEDYPLSRRLFMYTPSVPKNDYTLSFINFVLSDEGQKIAKNIGFVDLSIKTYTSRLDADQEVQNRKVFTKYLNTVSKAKRLSLNFRFRSNSFILDSRGIRDLKRVVDFLKRAENEKKEVILVGFTDVNGDYEYNYNLAFKRAKVVKDELRSRGIYQLRSISAGEEVPVASNKTTSGRSKNRRVEVWMK